MRRRKVLLLVWLLVAAVLGMFLFVDPIPQDQAYHSFVDQRTLIGIPNCWDVVTNVAFIPVGLVGLRILMRGVPQGALASQRVGYLTFFAGVAFIGLGSAFYHLNPGDFTLVWDRLPMTASFMAFVAVIIGEQIDERSGRLLLWPLVVTGLLSVDYWYYTEFQGAGDLRLYALVQFLPMLLLPAMLLLFRSPFESNRWVWLAMLSYGASKLAEAGDREVFEVIGFSGHSLKHLLAAAGALAFLQAIRSRQLRCGAGD